MVCRPAVCVGGDPMRAAVKYPIRAAAKFIVSVVCRPAVCVGGDPMRAGGCGVHHLLPDAGPGGGDPAATPRLLR